LLEQGVALDALEIATDKGEFVLSGNLLDVQRLKSLTEPSAAVDFRIRRQAIDALGDGTSSLPDQFLLVGGVIG